MRGNFKRQNYVAPTELGIAPEHVSTNITLLWSVFPGARPIGNIVESRY